MDRFIEMRTFRAVAEAGGFAAAARKLDASGPAVTRTVALLEARLGTRLLHRTTRRVWLTEAGERFLVNCQRILAEVTEAEDAAAGLHAAPRGRVVISASQGFGRLHVAPLLLEFLRLYPETQVHSLFTDRVVKLWDEGVDVAVRLGALPDSSLRAVRVGAQRNVVVASPAYLARRGVPRTPADLSAHDGILYTGITPGADWRFPAPGGQTLSVGVAARLVTDSAELAIRAAESGLGLTRLVHYQVQASLEQGRLDVVLADHEPVPAPVHVLHHQGTRVSAKVRALIDVLVQGLRRVDAEH